jgi:hypothetical protein
LDKWEKGRGVWAKCPSSSSLPHDTERRGQGGQAVEGEGAPASRCAATVGKWGETKRSSRATDSAPYLGLGCSGEADRRPAVGLLAVVTGAALVVAMEGSGRRGNWSWRCGARWGAGPTLL